MSFNYDDLGDILEYGNISDDLAVEICNILLEKIIKTISYYKNSETGLDTAFESMFNAIFLGVNNREIATRLNLDTIIDHIEELDLGSIDYLISIIAYTGNENYMPVLWQIKSNTLFKSLDVDEAIAELTYRLKKK